MVLYDTLDGKPVAYCYCYDCNYLLNTEYNGSEMHRYPMTLEQYREHKSERNRSYNEYKIRKAEQERAHTKETEAPGEHGRSPGVTTRFNLHTGQLSSDDDRLLGNVRWETLWRAYLQ